jgi:D-3-phosphoglycerate dehydrogenase
LFQILVFNSLSASGLKRLPAGRYHVGKEAGSPDAILLRSHQLQVAEIPDSVKAVARAGAGVNNIPVEELTRRGVPVFNAPGANANAVKELVLAAMLIGARNLTPALAFTQSLPRDAADFEAQVEEGKKAYAGVELPGRTLGVIGLGAIGGLVADTAIRLGMKVLGYDPEITVESAWRLPSSVRKAQSVDEVMKHSDFITLHLPLLPQTRHLVNAERLAGIRKGTVLLNFAREGIVEEGAVKAALAEKRLKAYLCDFPSPGLAGFPGVVAFPHLGASTAEAEENCAVMVVDQLRDFLEQGTVRHSVNFPAVEMHRESAYRIAISNANVPNMVGQISTTMARSGLNIHNMVNKSKGDMAYTLVDLDSAADAETIRQIASIAGVLSVRLVPPPEEGAA